MTHAYSPGTSSIVSSWDRVHGNGEQTRIAVLELGESYVAVAVDLDPRSYQPVAAECIAYDPTVKGAEQRATRWMEQHPKGVEPDVGSGESLFSRLWGFLQKLDQRAETSTEGENA